MRLDAHPSHGRATPTEKIEQGKRIVRGKLVRWGVRWALTGALAAVLLPRYPAWNWAFYILVLIGVLNLLMILRVYLQLHVLGVLATLPPEASSEE
jgi:hypothetical protein